MTPRQQAKERGDKYYEGQPCVRNKEHGTKRYTCEGKCVECKKKYYEKNIENILKKKKKYREENLNQFKEKDKKYYQKNTKNILKRQKKYYEENSEWILERDKKYHQKPEVKKRTNYLRMKKYHTDPVHRLKDIRRRQLLQFIKSVKGTKTGRTEELLGYTAEELKDHLESLFKDGMTWENQGKWHIDHRIPMSYFTSIDQLRECFALENLKPEWGEWNMSKGNRFIG